MEKLYQNRNYIFLGSISLAIMLLLIAYFVGNSDNKQFFADQADFVYATTLIDDGQLEQADQIFDHLLGKYPNNHNVVWQKGWSTAQLGNPDEAINHFMDAQDLNPVLTRDTTFLMQFSIVMLNAERFEEARTYLEHTKKQSGLTDEQLQLVDDWLEFANGELEALAKEEEAS